MFSVWNDNIYFLEKHDHVCLKHKVWYVQLQCSRQNPPHSSGDSGHVHSIGSFMCGYMNFTSFLLVFP